MTNLYPLGAKRGHLCSKQSLQQLKAKYKRTVHLEEERKFISLVGFNWMCSTEGKLNCCLFSFLQQIKTS